jgi:membrane protease YdiL (CAAX protease family)
MFFTLLARIPTDSLIPIGISLGSIIIFLYGLTADVRAVRLAFRQPEMLQKGLDRLRSRPWDLNAALSILFWLLLAYLLAGMLLSPEESYIANPQQGSPLRLALDTLFLPGALMGLVVWKLRQLELTWDSAFGLNSQRLSAEFRSSLFGYASAIPPTFVVGVISVLILNAVDYPVDRQPMVRYLARSGNPLWFNVYMAFVAVVVAPVTEEILFRGILLPTAARHARGWLAVAAVSLLFASLHGHLPSIAPLFSMAVVFSLAYIVTGSLTVPILIHALFNGINLFVFFVLKPHIA